MMERYLLRYFLSVIDQGNFSKAAAVCNVSQPTLSAGIAKLERDLGASLFHRTNRRVELTNAGARLAPLARRIETEFAQAEREVSASPLPDTIRVGMLVTTPTRWTEALFAEQSEATNERIEIVEGRERDIIERLARGRIDVALTVLREGEHRYRVTPIITEPYVLTFHRGHRLDGRASIQPEEALGETMIVRRQCEALADTSRYFTAHGVRPFFAARTADEERARSYVRTGVGVTVMPRSLAEGKLGYCELEGFGKTRNIGLLFAEHADVGELLQRASLQRLQRVVSSEAPPELLV